MAVLVLVAAACMSSTTIPGIELLGISPMPNGGLAGIVTVASPLPSNAGNILRLRENGIS
jgi:hypothetical protein